MTGTTDTTTTDKTTTDAGTSTTSTDTTASGGDGSGATDQTGTDATKTGTDEWANFDAERAKNTILNQRRVESELKQQLAEAKAKEDERLRAEMTEQEKLKADKEAAELAAQKARDDANAARFDAAAIHAGIPLERLAAARAVAGEVVSTDASGNMTIDTTVFDRLKAEHGYLFGQQAAPPPVSFGAAASQGQGGQGVGLTPDQIAMAQRGGMTPEEFAKYVPGA